MRIAWCAPVCKSLPCEAALDRETGLSPSLSPSLSLSLSILPFRPSYNVSSLCELCRLFPISCFFLFLCLFIVDLFLKLICFFKTILYLLVNLISPLFFFLFCCFFLSPFPSFLFVKCLSLISVSHFSISQYFSFFHSFSDLLMAVLIRHQYTHGWSSNVLKLLPFFSDEPKCRRIVSFHFFFMPWFAEKNSCWMPPHMSRFLKEESSFYLQLPYTQALASIRNSQFNAFL
jgi:hypothetical protein